MDFFLTFAECAITFAGFALRSAALFLADVCPNLIKFDNRHLKIAHQRVMQPGTALADPDAKSLP